MTLILVRSLGEGGPTRADNGRSGSSALQPKEGSERTHRQPGCHDGIGSRGRAVRVFSPTTLAFFNLFDAIRRQLRAELATLAPAKGRERQDALRRHINAWYDIERDYIPAVERLCVDSAQCTSPSQSVPLLLPSAISSSTSFHELFLTYEWRLREAQAYDALARVRGCIEVIAYVSRHDSAGSGAVHVRSSVITVVNVMRAEIDKDVVRYNDAYTAMSKLTAPLGQNSWQCVLKRLVDDDVRYVTERDSLGQTSWIWQFGGTAFLKPEQLHDIGRNKALRDGNNILPQLIQCLMRSVSALRTAWCTVRARAFESSADCKFLVGQMAQIATFYANRRRWWEDHVGRGFRNYPALQEGADAYAHRQASVCRSMEDHCSWLERVMECWFNGGHTGEDLPLPVRAAAVLNESLGDGAVFF